MSMFKKKKKKVEISLNATQCQKEASRIFGKFKFTDDRLNNSFLTVNTSLIEFPCVCIKS